MSDKSIVLAFTIPLSILVTVASLGGLLSPTLYTQETMDWMAQATAQDAVDLFLVVPILSVASLFVSRRERMAEPIWGGSLLYLAYTFLIYCFSIHFNSFFLVYIGTLGLSIYGLIYFMIRQHRQPAVKGLVDRRPAQFIGIYFLVIAILFFGLWLAEVIPATLGGFTPASVKNAGLVTNPVQVIDLSFFLPGIFIMGVLLLRSHRWALILAPVLLVFFVLMDITIVVIMIVQSMRLGTTNPVAMAMMSALTLLSGSCLLWMMRKSY